jgi:tetratricopeptide (TPR) repeat protein
VDAAVLARYVGDKVADWSRRIAQEQSIDIQQTPELVAGELREGVRILRLRDKDATGAPAGPALPARLGVLTVPDRARVFIDGRPVGLAPLIRNFPADSLAAGGEVKMRVEAPGIAPYERTIKLLPGYSQQVEVDLLKVRPTGAAGTTGAGTTGTTEPVSTSTTGVSNSAEDPLLGRAARAEEIGQYEVAESAYALILESDSKNAGAYERLSQLRARRGDWAGAINALADMNRKMPGARALTLLSRAYSSHSMRLAASEATLPTKLARGRVSVQPWLVPKTSWENAIYALNAADAALKADPKSTDALIARGLAFVAGDVTGNDQKQAMESLSRAYPDRRRERRGALRVRRGPALLRASEHRRGRPQGADGARAPVAGQAIELRPSFYEARREMALAAALMGDRELALRECEVAILAPRRRQRPRRNGGPGPGHGRLAPEPRPKRKPTPKRSRSTRRLRPVTPKRPRKTPPTKASRPRAAPSSRTSAKQSPSTSSANCRAVLPASCPSSPTPQPPPKRRCKTRSTRRKTSSKTDSWAASAASAVKPAACP